MKTLATVVAAVVLTVSVAACQKKENPVASKPAAPVAEKVEKKEKKEVSPLERQVRNHEVRIKRLEDAAKRAGVQ